MDIVTCVAPINIACVKYWGKRDEKLILPVNDSISITLSSKVLCAKTTVAISPDFKKCRIWLNGREENFATPRLLNCLNEIRERARKNGDEKCQGRYEWNVHICSENNFPTAAGLASSAAGYACLVFALSKLFGVTGDISEIARRGSGSACRSILGGFVRWHMGKEKDGTDSVATQVAPADHWKELRTLILVVDGRPKKTSSTSGMRDTVETSQLLKMRTEFCVPERVKQCIDAIKRKDFQSFAELTMKDSNQFHAVCLDTYPPVTYLSDASHAIIDLVHAFNDAFNEIKVAYTFDAGQNAFLFCLEKDAPLVLALIKHYFPPRDPSGYEYFRGEKIDTVELPLEVIQSLGSITPYPSGTLKGIIHSEIGEGPSVLSDTEHLLNENGLPK
ncbi:UNVERIFIED_CONTAM: hypothetical protein PYX00_001329 [Menopon gallinae]|uniref:Diphosphomevalonate decarboxylase n=1 Tax=Menopon gallinae TaxID=328185 RepID=A0AAW2IDS2_9NEOP